MHPEYDTRTKRFDQLILKLSGASQAQVLNLQQHFSLSAEQTNLTVLGFGMADNDGQYPSSLLQSQHHYIPTEECSEMSSPAFSFKYTLHSDMLCATGNKTGVCYGDSGGPLIALGDSPDKDQQIGLVSW
jgi:secreted trypsin-like serine protease